MQNHVRTQLCIQANSLSIAVYLLKKASQLFLPGCFPLDNLVLDGYSLYFLV